jgi:hypothetical protein
MWSIGLSLGGEALASESCTYGRVWSPLVPKPASFLDKSPIDESVSQLLRDIE